jgi:hypothetical protein
MKVSIQEAAKVLRLSPQTVRRRVKNGELPGVQVDTPQGFVWVVEVSEDVSNDSPTDEAMVKLVAALQAQIEGLNTELEARRREVQELHVLLQQAALPAPKEHRPWWQWWRQS